MVLMTLGNESQRPRIIYDCRGAIVDEIDNITYGIIRTLLKKVRKREFRAVECTATQKADIVLAVSSRMSEYLAANYGRPANLVIHSIVDNEKFKFNPEMREHVRKELKLTSERVYIYVGSTYSWQRLDLLNIWWKNHYEKYPSDILLVLTPDADDFRDKAKLSENMGLIIKTVKHAEVPGYMWAADFGVIFRDDSIVNQVASPVKLSEYLAAGLQIITNQSFLSEISPENCTLVDPVQRDYEYPQIDDYQNRSNKSFQMGQIFSADYAVKCILEYMEQESGI
jgi:hypothetical protein